MWQLADTPPPAHAQCWPSRAQIGVARFIVEVNLGSSSALFFDHGAATKDVAGLKSDRNAAKPMGSW
jgi:hypothetical protein